jgi:carboxylate-amine ligase
VIEDYTYLWYDVRPHPWLGTVEISAMDSQTRVEHTLALAALVLSLVKRLVEGCEQGEPMVDPPWEVLDENRWLAARHGLDAELLDTAGGARRPVRDWAAELLEQLAPHARALGCAGELEGIEDLMRAGNGAQRQQMVFEANRDLRELMREIVEHTTPQED